MRRIRKRGGKGGEEELGEEQEKYYKRRWRGRRRGDGGGREEELVAGRILTIAGITIAICSAPVVATSNMVVLAVWPTWITVAITETIRKVTTYVVTRPGRELLFTVVSQDEKYKAKMLTSLVILQIFIDVIVQRLGDATAAGVYKLLFGSLNNRTSMVSLYALPVCVINI
ncbi:hypothetical protein B296_00023873 [Ensete ventricosum]|uniref:Uncharacterized protein n=1 Tax=Ensete ventricosum TaxID=4639 RepID=A0A426ZNH5_ENSVE|nr:hypothetical protein B296_00023873 [Ensete ventricosum]